jgi:hypothetical protein
MRRLAGCCRAPGDDELNRRRLNRLVALVEGLNPDRHYAAVRTGLRRLDVDNLTFNVQGVAGARGARPISIRRSRLSVPRRWGGPAHQQAHRYRRSVPAAGRESAKERSFGKVITEMKCLRIELGGKADYLFLINFDTPRW